MKAADIREMTLEEIDAKEREMSEELMKLRFQRETGQLSNFSQIRAIRRDIARLHTVRSEMRKGVR